MSAGHCQFLATLLHEVLDGSDRRLVQTPVGSRRAGLDLGGSPRPDDRRRSHVGSRVPTQWQVERPADRPPLRPVAVRQLRRG